MSERRQAAWDEAQRRYPTGDRQAGFVSGAAWADDNPHSTPEALVAAYEEGQRDAVSKGLANPQPRTITRAALRDTAMMLEHTRQDEIEAILPGLLGIEVVGDE